MSKACMSGAAEAFWSITTQCRVSQMYAAPLPLNNTSAALVSLPPMFIPHAPLPPPPTSPNLPHFPTPPGHHLLAVSAHAAAHWRERWRRVPPFVFAPRRHVPHLPARLRVVLHPDRNGRRRVCGAGARWAWGWGSTEQEIRRKRSAMWRGWQRIGEYIHSDTDKGMPLQMEMLDTTCSPPP